MQTIDLLYLIPITLVIIGFLAAGLVDKIRWWIMVSGIGLGIAITYFAAPYYQYSIIPIRNFLLYRTDFDLLTGAAFFHVISISFVSLMAFKNLYATGGFTIFMMIFPKSFKKDVKQLKEMRHIWKADKKRSRRSMRKDSSGLIGILAITGILAATTLAGWGVYNFFQNPDVTYNIDAPIGGSSEWLPLSAGGVGLNTDLIIIVAAIVIFGYFVIRAQKD